MSTQQIHQQRRDQGSVHHKPRIAFDLGRIAAIIVDPMPVERQRRVAKQQHVVRLDRPFPRGIRRRGLKAPQARDRDTQYRAPR